MKNSFLINNLLLYKYKALKQAMINMYTQQCTFPLHYILENFLLAFGSFLLSFSPSLARVGKTFFILTFISCSHSVVFRKSVKSDIEFMVVSG